MWSDGVRNIVISLPPDHSIPPSLHWFRRLDEFESVFPAVDSATSLELSLDTRKKAATDAPDILDRDVRCLISNRKKSPIIFHAEVVA
jgi:hypothetical protein